MSLYTTWWFDERGSVLVKELRGVDQSFLRNTFCFMQHSAPHPDLRLVQYKQSSNPLISTENGIDLSKRDIPAHYYPNPNKSAFL